MQLSHWLGLALHPVQKGIATVQQLVPIIWFGAMQVVHELVEVHVEHLGRVTEHSWHFPAFRT